MEQALVDYILKQHAEADAWMAAGPDRWMGKLPDPADTEYWAQRVPSGTLKEFQRIELEEDAYYTLAEAYSKSYARAHDFSSMTDEELNELCESASRSIQYDIEREKQEKAEEEAQLDRIAKDIDVDRATLDRWLEAA
jgi:hypothetical protein